MLAPVGPLAYRLALPDKYTRMHNVFPVSSLELWKTHRGETPKDPLTIPDLKDDPEEWEVEEVTDSRRIKGVLHYLVKWEGWPSEYSTWEPEEHLENAKGRVNKFLKAQRQKTKPRGPIT